MSAVELAKGVYWVGVDDLETRLFEGIWSIPGGISYNSYLIIGEEAALIDCVSSRYSSMLLDSIREVTDPADIRYVIVNHAEPDHTGALPAVLSEAKEAKVVATRAAIFMLRSLYEVGAELVEAKDGMQLGVGGRLLKFIRVPWLHWPDTMVTYLTDEKVLFSCDAFGAYGALRGRIYASEHALGELEAEAKRYYANIVAKYGRHVQSALSKLKGLEVKLLAPSHGPVYRSPERVIKLYDKWSRGELEYSALVYYGSMYGSTRRVAEEIASHLREAGLKVYVHNASTSDFSIALRDALCTPALIVGSPTYEGDMMPQVKAFLDLLQLKGIKPMVAGVFGSYGWAGGAVKHLIETLREMGAEVVEPHVGFKGAPSKEDYIKARQMAEAIVKAVASVRS